MLSEQDKVGIAKAYPAAAAAIPETTRSTRFYGQAFIIRK
jgi:hypothetical protein